MAPEEQVEPVPQGRPRKVDIDKMHAYRDAIRTGSGGVVVTAAAILYPGESQTYSTGLAAIGAVPGRSDEARGAIRMVLAPILDQSGRHTGEAA